MSSKRKDLEVVCQAKQGIKRQLSYKSGRLGLLSESEEVSVVALIQIDRLDHVLVHTAMETIRVCDSR